MKQLKLISVLVLYTAFFFAQDAKREIVNINKAHFANAHVAMRIVNKAYRGNEGKPVSESQLEVYKVKGKFLFRSLSSESMSNGNYKINLDNKKKLIVINKVTNKTLPDKKQNTKVLDGMDYSMVLDTVLNYYKDVRVRQKNETQNEMEFVFKTGMYESIKITYDKKTYLVYDYYIKVKPGKDQDQPYTYTINHYYYQRSALTKALFNENNYVVLKKGKVLPSSKYAGYRIIDNINKKSDNI